MKFPRRGDEVSDGPPILVVNNMMKFPWLSDEVPKIGL